MKRFSYTRDGDQNFFLIFGKNLKKFLKKLLTNYDAGGNIAYGVWEIPHSTAMMREIAAKAGNFRGVCPVIGRLNCPVTPAYIAVPKGERSALRRPFFMAWSDTHGGVNRTARPYPDNHYVN